jgi:hypothetical protein
MNWEIISSTGEWAGALAVVVTLFYLARQIKQQNELSRYNAWESLFQGFNQNNQLVASDPDVAQLLLKGFDQPDTLSDAESAQWIALYRTYFNHMQRAYRAYELGYLTENDWKELARNFATDTRTAGGSRFRSGHEQFMSEFWAAIDQHYDESFEMVDYSFNREKGA